VLTESVNSANMDLNSANENKNPLMCSEKTIDEDVDGKVKEMMNNVRNRLDLIGSTDSCAW
jgi:hypothetical protein